MIQIRTGTADDLNAVHELIIELAIFEKEPDAVKTTVESMLHDGFGRNPVFGFFVATFDETIVGLSLFYDRYSTWRGRCLYLEDLIVTEPFRRQGIGKQLFDRTLKKARDEGYRGMSWQVLDWNEPAINFYRKYGVKLDEKWVNCLIDN
ncbi:MAG: GNAT family N-acetyltransferase [Planctomycetota bacterium]